MVEMKSKKEILESGILEEYVLGILSDTENSEVRSYLNSYPELKDHVSALEDSLLKLAQENAIAAPPVVKKPEPSFLSDRQLMALIVAL